MEKKVPDKTIAKRNRIILIVNSAAQNIIHYLTFALQLLVILLYDFLTI